LPDAQSVISSLFRIFSALHFRQAQGAPSVQNETSMYEMPPERLVFNHHGLGEGRELGQATVVSTLRGKARIQILIGGRAPRPAWVWPLAAAAVVAAGLAIAWYTHNWPFSAPTTAETPAEESRPAPDSGAAAAPDAKATNAAAAATATPDSGVAVAVPPPTEAVPPDETVIAAPAAPVAHDKPAQPAPSPAPKRSAPRAAAPAHRSSAAERPAHTEKARTEQPAPGDKPAPTAAASTQPVGAPSPPPPRRRRAPLPRCRARRHNGASRQHKPDPLSTRPRPSVTAAVRARLPRQCLFRPWRARL
jgi:hypothetical protein